MLPAERLHLAFEDGPFRMAMGLTPCAPADWIEVDARRPAELAERHALVATRRGDVFGAMSGSEAARAEARFCSTMSLRNCAGEKTVSG